MSRRTLAFVTLLISLLAFPCAQAKRGGLTDGGGTICIHPTVNAGEPLLLDLSATSRALIDPSHTGHRFQTTKVAATLGFDTLAIDKTPAFALARRKLSDWRHGGIEELAIVESAMQSLSFFATPYRIGRVNRAELIQGSPCQAMNLVPAALYFGGRAFLSIPVWNSIGLYSQAGLIIHESLRQLQLSHGLNAKDGELQDLTASLLLGKRGSPDEQAIKKSPFLAQLRSSLPEIHHAKQSACQLATKLANLKAIVASTEASQVVANVVETCGNMMERNELIDALHGHMLNLLQAAEKSEVMRLSEKTPLALIKLSKLVRDWRMALRRYQFDIRTHQLKDQLLALDIAMYERLAIEALREMLDHPETQDTNKMHGLEASLSDVRSAIQILFDNGTLTTDNNLGSERGH